MVRHRFNPFENADIISKLLFTWCIKYFFKIQKIPSNTLYLFDILSDCHSLNLGASLENAWLAEVDRARKLKKQPSMIKVTLKIFSNCKFIIVDAVLTAFRHCTIVAFQPIIIGYTVLNIAFINVKDAYEIAAICLLLALLLISFLIDALLSRYVSFKQKIQGLKIRVALRNVIYKKIVSLPKKLLTSQEMDNLLELIYNDVDQIEQVVSSISIVICTPLIIGVYTLIFRYMFPNTVHVINLFLLFGVLVQMLCFYCLSVCKRKLKKDRKARFIMISNVMEKFETLKIIGQEKKILDLLNKQKSGEWKYLFITNMLKAFIVSIFTYMYIIMLGAGIIVYSSRYCCMSIKYVLVLLMYVIKLGGLVTVHFPQCLYTLIDSWQLLNRIGNFLMLDEAMGDSMIYNDTGEIEFINVTSMQSTIYLNLIYNSTFIVPSGKLCILTGSPNSGKSTIIPLILQELAVRNGTIKLGGAVAYYTKTDVLLDTTLKNNITMEREFDRRHYKFIKKICGLVSDFKNYPDKDNMNVNDMNLSASTKAKIILARTLYEESDIYLFKFPLPHLINSVGREIFESCIIQYLKNKTRLIETFDSTFLEKADLILYFNDGRITAADTYENLKVNIPNFDDILLEDYDYLSYCRLSTTREILELKKNKYSNRETILHQKELLFYQIPTMSLVIKYLHTSGFPIALIFQQITALLLCIFSLACQFLAIQWYVSCSLLGYIHSSMQDLVSLNKPPLFRGCKNLVYYNSYNNTKTRPGFISIFHVFDHDVPQNQSTNVLIFFQLPLIYVCTIILNTFLEFIRILTSSLISTCAGNHLYKQIIKSILFAPYTYFQSKHLELVYPMLLQDIIVLEDILPTKILELFRTMTTIVCLTLMYYFLNKYYTILSVLIILMGLLMNQLLFKVIKDIRFVEEKINEKLHVHIENTLNSSVIREASVEETFVRHFSQIEDLHSSVHFLYMAVHTAFSLWSPTIFMLCHSGLMYYLILKSEKDFQKRIDRISFIFINYYYIYHTVSLGTKMFTIVANNSIRMKNLFDIIANETEEDDFEIPYDSKLLSQWPFGRVEFKMVTLSLSHKIALQDVSFTINAGEKVAVLDIIEGGKSGLIMAMLRLHPYQGTILIDYLNIGNIGLHTLRQKISYVSPQLDIFNDSLRVMFNEFNDNDIWEAIEKVELKDVYPSLEHCILEENVKLSTKLLLHLARALLTKNKIIVADKITEGVNKRNVQLANRILEEHFHDCTIINICSKFEEAASYERIILMSDGFIIDDDIPENISKKHFNEDHNVDKNINPYKESQDSNI